MATFKQTQITQDFLHQIIFWDEQWSGFRWKDEIDLELFTTPAIGKAWNATYGHRSLQITYSDGKCKIPINGKQHDMLRIAWLFWHGGDYPKKVIPINGNRYFMEKENLQRIK